MAKVNFYLRDASAKIKSQINLMFHWDNQRIKIPTGFSVYPKYWNAKAQRVREVMDFPQYAYINIKLENYANVVLKIYNDSWNAGIIIEPEDLKKQFYALKDIPMQKTKPKSLWDYFEEFIAYKRKQLTDIRDYNNSLRKHLKRAEQIFGKPLTFSALQVKNGGFVDIMDNYLTYEAKNTHGEPGMSTNAIGKQFKNLKVFLNWYFDEDLSRAFSLKHMITKTEEVDTIYLKASELEKLENYVLTDPKNALVRDLFLIGCETGLRFSDYTRISREHIQNGNLHFRPKKTEGKVANNKIIIPISTRLNIALENMFNSQVPIKTLTITNFNNTIRKICELAQIDDEIMIYKKVAGKSNEYLFKKYQLVSSHTCRRTFCTLKFLDDMPARVIMKFSGHKTERAFMKYLKLDAEVVASKYASFFK